MNEERTFECPLCGKEITYTSRFRDVYYNERENVVGMFSRDCYGIPFRLICIDCYDEVMDTKGYDGEYYTELDECIGEYW